MVDEFAGHLLAEFLDQVKSKWVLDAYEGSMTPIGWDETWIVTIGRAGHFKLVVQEDEAYTNTRLCERQLTGQWVVVETSAEHFLLLITEAQWQILYNLGAPPALPTASRWHFQVRGEVYSLKPIS
jgi:hypothetical protein